jgi:hypothetical protein
MRSTARQGKCHNSCADEQTHYAAVRHSALLACMCTLEVTAFPTVPPAASLTACRDLQHAWPHLCSPSKSSCAAAASSCPALAMPIASLE